MLGLALSRAAFNDLMKLVGLIAVVALVVGALIGWML